MMVCGDIMNILFDWCNRCGVQKVMYLIKTLINIIRWVVPIGLVVMTSLDIAKKVLNPDEKEGQKKIMHRVIAGLIVFFIPLFIRFVLGIVDKGAGNNSGTASYSSALQCWNNARIDCDEKAEVGN